MAQNVHKMKRVKLEPIIFNTMNTLIMLIVMAVMIYPFWNTIAVSFNNSQDTLRGGITFFPRQFSLYNYETVFNNDLLITASLNSVLRTVFAIVLGVFTSAMIAYVLSRPEFLWRKFVTRYFLITMYVSAGLIPQYFLIRNLGMINSFAVYIIPGMINAFHIIVVKAYIQTLPGSLVEASKIDGAGHLRCFIQIILPVCKPVLATVALWCAVGAWNSWFDTFIYNSSKDKLTTLQYEMMKMISASMSSGTNKSADAVYGNVMVTDAVTPVSIRAAVTIVASVPILVVCPFLQKYFVSGVVIGAVKG